MSISSITGPTWALDKPQGNKFDHGHAFVISGGPGQTGAARLAAQGALRIGAGLVTLGVPPAAQLEVSKQVTAIMLRRIPDAAALSHVLQDKRLTALCLGPGMGLSDEKAALVGAALAAERPTVLDADALTLLGRNGPLFARLHDRCVLTPHMGEFARLFPDLARDLQGGLESDLKNAQDVRAAVVSRAAKRAGCTVLLKGPQTVIATADGGCSGHDSTGARAVPWLATAGSGDVLAGFITGLLARGAPPRAAAETATWLHTECALAFGAGLVAEDLPEILPQILRRIIP